MKVQSLDKLFLLLWKNVVIQWRHKIQTLVEIFIPVLCGGLIVLIRSLMGPTSQPEVAFEPFNPLTLMYSTNVLQSLNSTNLSLAYSPNTPIAENVVRNAVRRLIRGNLEAFGIPNLPEVVDIIDSIISLSPYQNASQLDAAILLPGAVNDIIAGVQFDDSLQGEQLWPNKSHYELRFPSGRRLFTGRDWRTDQLYPMYPRPGPRSPGSIFGGNDPGYVPQMFLALQHAVSMELIIAKARDFNVTDLDELDNLTIQMQRFPHPAYNADEILNILQEFIPLFILLSFIYTATNTVKIIVTEKEDQLKEAMKIMGLSTWLHWTAWFLKQYAFTSISVVLLIILFKVEWYTTDDGVADYSVLTHTPTSVLLFFMLLYMATALCFCFVISSIFSKANTGALLTGVIWFLMYSPYTIMSSSYESLSLGVKLISCLSVNTAMGLGFRLILTSEGSTRGLHWDDFFSPVTTDEPLVFGYVVLMLILDIVLYLSIALYLEKVLPGNFGIPLLWYFPFTKDYWMAPSTARIDDFDDSSVPDKNLVFEKDPSGLIVGVSIINLSKAFVRSTKAVNNLNLQIFEDQITVLLGHNGAGKTTTISMLTGMIPASSGRATVGGHNIATNTAAARSLIGFCPQHNILFRDLTVAEHIQFFARLKGMRGEQLDKEVNYYIRLLKLTEKRDSLSSALSGGQQRRLCVGIALCGGTRVVLLDEPTSGMDPSARRDLWDLLQKEKEGRTIILTTHFMDEADVLGDRIAIMAEGRLQCVGSPFFLKQHYGVGYTLVMVKKPECRVDMCTALLTKYIPGLAVNSDIGTELSYLLPKEASGKFEAMLQDLEQHTQQLALYSYGLAVTTLEEVFMKVGTDLNVNKKEQAFDGRYAEEYSNGDTHNYTTADSTVYRTETTPSHYISVMDYKVSGTKLLLNHIHAMFYKKALTTSRSWILNLLQIFIPVILLLVAILVLRTSANNLSVISSRELTLEVGYTRTVTLMGHEEPLTPGGISEKAMNGYSSYFESTGLDTMVLTDVGQSAVNGTYLELGTPDMSRVLYENLVGATFGDSVVTSWFSNFAYHDVATSLATLHRALLRGVVPSADLTVYNHPLPQPLSNQITTQSSVLGLQIAFNIGMGMAIVSSFYVMFYIKERVSRAKLLQKASGVQPWVMWGSALLFDWLCFAVIAVALVVVAAATNIDGFSTFSELGRLLLVLLVFGASMLPWHYIAPLFFNKPSTGFVRMYFINLFLGVMGFTIVEVLTSLGDVSTGGVDLAHVGHVMDQILLFYPHYCLCSAIMKLNSIAVTELMCAQTCSLVHSLLGDRPCDAAALCDFSPEFSVCCVRENPYFDWASPGIAKYLVYMVSTGIVMFVVLMIIEYRVISKFFYFTKTPPPPPSMQDEDEDVTKEKERVDLLLTTDYPDYHLVCKDLTKFYKKNLAVNQTSLAIKKGECFGLLGVNGAGKTTTFKMLTGDLDISSGDAWVQGNSIKSQIKAVHKQIGYCPQFDALFEDLTGRETLKLYCLLRGIPGDIGASLTIDLALNLGFNKHLDKRVNTYSGGNKRKLSTAIALLGDAPLIYLDEPTTGMDPAAKRQVWRSIVDCVHTGRSVVLTSHSMEECEALCTRLAIMVGGRFRCLGSPQHLKNKFSNGYTLNIKVSMENNQHPMGEPLSTPVHQFVTQNFPTAQLMESYQGLVTYYISDGSLPWSRMFGLLEGAKEGLRMEDYSISQTSLEQVFLRFSKQQELISTES